MNIHALSRIRTHISAVKQLQTYALNNMATGVDNIIHVVFYGKYNL